LALIREIVRRGVVPGKYPNATQFVADFLVVTRKEAGRLVRLATLDLVVAKSAMGEGALSLGQLGAIADVLDDIAAVSDDAEDVEEAERILAQVGATNDANALKGLGKRIMGELDPDGKRPKDDDPVERTGNSLRTGYLKNGLLKIIGQLSAEAGAQLMGLLGPLAAPRTDPDGRDPRDADERDGDALAEVIGLAAKCNEHTQGGDDVAVSVTVPLERLENVDGGRTLLPGIGKFSPEALRRMACDARVIPVVLGSKGEVLDVGRSSRLATTAQRRALEVRDKGCVFPGCCRSTKWCTPHHVRHWAQGGPTDLGNMALLCAHHHRKIHHSEWEIQMRDGLPWLIPPAWLDPLRAPLRV
jgi:hypothetical protein